MSSSDATDFIRVETYVPEYAMRDVPPAEVPAIYEGLGNEPAAFTWNDGGDEVLMVSVGDDYSTASILIDRTFYDLAEGAGDGESTIVLSGDVVDYPDELILPRKVGLELLMRMPDFRGIVEGHDWRAQD
jgi:hypothetical protein